MFLESDGSYFDWEHHLANPFEYTPEMDIKLQVSPELEKEFKELDSKMKIVIKTQY